jgi:hemerythrin-like domain-containing protein
MKDYLKPRETRRNFLVKSGLLLAATSFWGACGSTGPEKAATAGAIPPTEDLMREHGVLGRIMLVYEEIGRRLRGGEEFPVQALTEANEITRRFMQDYHEKNEETHLFNRFSSAGKLTELVATLYQQHLAGRRLTDEIKRASTADNLKNPEERLRVADLMASFNRLYRPHAAWEDTVLFPACRSVISGKDFTALGETFDQDGTKLFGAGGFAKIVGQVDELEKKVGIFGLQQFTPKV